MLTRHLMCRADVVEQVSYRGIKEKLKTLETTFGNIRGWEIDTLVSKVKPELAKNSFPRYQKEMKLEITKHFMPINFERSASSSDNSGNIKMR